MYASIRRYKTDPALVDEVLRQARDLVPLISRVPDFVAYHVLDAGNGVVASISIFHDKAGADQSDRLAADWQRQHLAALVPDPPEITAGEIVIDKMSPTPFRMDAMEAEFEGMDSDDIV